MVFYAQSTITVLSGRAASTATKKMATAPTCHDTSNYSTPGLHSTLPDSVSQMLSALFNTRVCLTQSPKHREHCLTQVSSVPILRVNGLVLNASNDKPANTTTLSTLSLLSSEVKGITTTMSKVSFKFNTRSSVSFSVNGK